MMIASPFRVSYSSLLSYTCSTTSSTSTTTTPTTTTLPEVYRSCNCQMGKFVDNTATSSQTVQVGLHNFARFSAY